MPDRDYTVTFKVDTNQAVAGIAALKAEFKQLDGYINGLGGVATTASGQMNQLGSSINQINEAIAVNGKNAKTSTGEMLAMGVAMVGINVAITAGITAIGELGAKATAARDHIKELAIETMGLRDQMRELANLKGKTGPDNEVVAETVKMGMKAGMMPDDMRKYLEQFEGSSPAGVQMGHIDDKTKQEMALEGAKFANRVKLSPQTGGDLAGVISQYTDLTKDKDGKPIAQQDRVGVGMAQMGRIAYGLNEGRGNLEPLVRSLLNTAGSVVGGPVEDLGELAAIQGVASTHANPREAGTRVRQAVRALRDTSGPAGMFLKNVAKVTDQDTHIQRLEKIKPLLDQAEKNGKGADIALRGMGFSDDDEIRAIVEEVHDLDIIKQRIANGRAKVTGQAVMKADDDFQNKDRAGMRRKQMAAKAGQDFLKGENDERVTMGKETAEQQLKDEHKIGGWTNNIRDFIGDFGGIKTWLGGESTRDRMLGDRADDNLVKEAKRLGVSDKDIEKLTGFSAKTNPEGERFHAADMRSERERVEGFNKLATEVERRQGNFAGQGPNLEPKFDALIAETRETNRLLQQQAQKNGAGQPPPAPPVPPMRAAAAPKRP